MKTPNALRAAIFARAGQVAPQASRDELAAGRGRKIRGRKADLAQRISRLENRIGNLNSEKSELEQRATRLRSQLREAEKDVASCNGKIEALTEELGAAQVHLTHVGKALTRSKRRMLRAVEHQLTGIRGQASGCTHKVDEVEHRIKRRIDKIEVEPQPVKARAATPITHPDAEIPKKIVAKASQRAASAVSSIVAGKSTAKPVNVPEIVEEAEHSEPPAFLAWLGEQFQELTSVEGVEEHHVHTAVNSLKAEAEEFSSCEKAQEKAQKKVSGLEYEIEQQQQQLHYHTSRVESYGNELKSVELQIAEIQAEIDLLNWLTESMRQEQERAAEEDRIREEQAEAEAEYQRELERQRQESIRAEEFQRLQEQARHLQQEIQFQSQRTRYETARADANHASERSRETEKLVDSLMTQSLRTALKETRVEAQIDCADVHFSSIISFLKSVIGSAGSEGAVSCSMPSGVRMSGELAEALNEIAVLKSTIDEVEDDQADGVFAQSQREARRGTLQAILDGLVPEPRHVKQLAVTSNAPAEWVARLDEHTRRLDELNAQMPKHGQLKGVLEQKKMDELGSFIDFMSGIGADNFVALLEGRSVSLEEAELADSNSNRRKHLDSVLDGLFCA